MKGNLSFTDGAWRLKVNMGKDPLTGKRRVLNRSVREPNTAKGRKAAEAVLAHLVVEVEGGRVTPAGGTGGRTVGDALDEWMETKRHAWKLGTQRRYACDVRAHLKPFEVDGRALGDLPLHKVTAAHWSALFEGMQKHGLDSDSVFTVFSTARAALNWMKNAKQWIPDHPLGTLVTVPSPRNAEVHIPPRDDLRLLFKGAHLEDPAFEVWLRIAASFGARRGTLAGLHINDVDTGDGYITFVCAISEGEKSLVGVGERPLQECLLKADNPYTASIEAPLIPFLERQIARRRDELQRLGVDEHSTHCDLPCGHPDGGHHLFSADGVSCWNPNAVSKVFRRVADNVGLEYLHLHHLKHFAASTMLTRGVPIAIVAQRMGTSEQMILRRYRRFIRGADRQAANVMGDELYD